jgi:phage shock protein PspC (stress-responsive transcriptional regulator)
MNEVKKCSISGIAFTLELDAYEALSAYLDSLKKRYASSEEGEEILADIEARVAELILSAQDNSRTVALPLVKNIIQQLGSADQIEESEEPKRESAPSTRIPRRLYRDTEGAKLGGVCAGLGRYFNIDPVWIRLALFLPLILSCMGHISFLHWCNPLMGNLFNLFVIAYLVMWFSVPVARTARQKLEMEGEPITAQAIGDRASSRSDVDGHPKQVVAETVSGFGMVLLILLKIFAGLLLTGLLFFACLLLVALFVVPTIELGIPLLLCELALLVILMPVALLVYALMSLIISHRPSGKVVLVAFILWVVMILGLCVGCAKYAGVEEHLLPLPSPSYNPQNLLQEALEEPDSLHFSMDHAMDESVAQE